MLNMTKYKYLHVLDGKPKGPYKIYPLNLT